MPIEFSLREHKRYNYNPNFIFSKSEASVLRMSNKAGSIWSLGDGYFFIVVDRVWLNGKYLRWRWQADLTGSTSCSVRVYDGAYDRSSDVDFPFEQGRIIKGNGLLQTLRVTSATFGWETRDVQTSLAGGSEEFCTIFINVHDGTSGGNCYLDLDWFEINSGAGGSGPFYDEQFTGAVNMERSGGDQDYGYISTGTALPMDSVDFLARFEVGQDSRDLLVRFEVGQGSRDLLARFHVGQGSVNLSSKTIIRQIGAVELFAKVIIRRMDAVELPAKVRVTHSQDLLCHVCIRKIYNFSAGMGVSFGWWGSGEGDQNIDFEMWSPTGGWVGKFPDGPARWRQVTLSWDDLTEVDFDGSRPEKSNIVGMYWTYHTPGVRRVDAIQTWMIRDLYCTFIVKNVGSSDLPGKFEVNLAYAAEELYAHAEIRQPASAELLARFEVGQDSAELLARFEVGQDSTDLYAKFVVAGFQVSIREHYSSANPPIWVYSKPTASILRGTSGNSSQGASYFFFVVSREWLHDKYLRITWKGDYSWGTWGTRVYIYDGAYDRSSDVDFPFGAPILNKGNGLLQTLLTHAGDFGSLTEEGQIDTSGGIEPLVTVFILSADSWTGQNGYYEVDMVEINSGPGGVGTLYNEPFKAAINMERTGSLGDYGYISEGELPQAAGSGELFAKFVVNP